MSDATTPRVILVRDCGHEADVTATPPERRPAVGDEVACWSSCDNVPTGRGRPGSNARAPRPRHVARYEAR